MVTRVSHMTGAPCTDCPRIFKATAIPATTLPSPPARDAIFQSFREVTAVVSGTDIQIAKVHLYKKYNYLDEFMMRDFYVTLWMDFVAVLLRAGV
ncbi:MAG TPA: hypothetical protein VF240_13325 [Pyrinomonadaceae bacterium]